MSGSTTGATTNNPAIDGQNLTWSGSFTVSGGSSITLHFAVTVSTTPGDYFNEAGGSAAQGYNVIGTGPTAKITVTAVSTATILTVSPAKGTYGGFDDPIYRDTDPPTAIQSLARPSTSL